MGAAKSDVTRASLQVALLYVFAEHVKAQTANREAEATDASLVDVDAELEQFDATQTIAQEGQEELDPAQAAALLRDLINEELAITAQARGIDPEQRLALEQELESSQSLSASQSTLQANAGSEGAAKGFEWTDLKIGETGFSPFAVMGGGLLFNSLFAGGGPAAIVAKAVLYANGIVADGYIAGATVKLLDANGNVIAWTETDPLGRYTFDDELLKRASKVVASGGKDISTNRDFDIELSAPSGATVINPLTTLVQSFIEANPGMSAAKAMQAVRTALGIPDSQDLLTLDPIAAAMSGTAEQKSLALALQIKAAQVANLLITASSAMRASDPGLSLQDAMSKIIGGLTQQIANVASGAQKPFALNDVSIISSVTGLSGDAVSLIAEGNTFSADSLEGIYEFQKLVQDDLSNILSLGGTMSAEALKSLTALLKFVSQGNKVVDFKLAPFSDTSLNGSALLTHVADPSVRIDLKPLANTVKVGDTIQLTQEGRAPTTVIVTPEDVARGYVDIKLPTFTQDGSATITVTVTDSQTQKPVASGVAAITYDSTVSAIGAQIAPHTDPVGGAGKPNVMITVTGLEAGAVWQYSLDNGKTWSAQISGPSTPVAVPQGAFVLTLRQIDRAGNESAPSQIKFEYSAGNFAPALTGAKAVLVDGVEDRSTIIKASDLLKGYSDAENQNLSIVNLTAKGDAGLVIQVVANNDGTYTLTAPANYNGAVVLSYGVSDGVAVTSASQQLSITAVNDAAVLSSATVTLDETNEALSTSGKLTVTDVDSAQTFQVQTNVAGTHGKFSIDAQGNWSYSANTALNSLNVGDSVSDTFTVASADGTQTSVKVTINGTNDSAVLSSAAVTLDETHEALSTSGKVTVTDIDSGETFQVQTNVAGTHGKFSIDAQGNWSYIANTALNSLNVGDSVSDTFTVASADGTQTSVKVTINGTNDAAVLSSALVALEENNEALSTNGTLTISDVDSGETFVVQTNAAGTYGKFSIDAQGNWSYTANTALGSLNVGDSVSDTFTVASADGTQTSVKVTINGTNDAAVLSSAVESLDETNEALSTSGKLTLTDVDSGETFQVQTNVAGTHGKFSIDAQGNWSYIANTALNSLNVGDSVSDTFTVASADGTQTSVKVTIKGTNDAAVLSSAELTLDETNAALSTNGKLTVTDVDSAETFKAQTDVAGTHGKFSIDAQGNWTYVANTALNSLNASDSVSDTFPVESADGTKTSVKVTITGTNDAAVLSSAEVTLDETNAALSTNGKLTVTDVDSAETFKAQTDVAGTHGKFSIDAQGNWTYVANTALNSLNASDSVSDTFTVESADGTKTSVKVTITGTNDAAVLSSAEVTLDETNAVLSTNGKLTVTDLDSAETFKAQTDVAGTHGKFSIDAQGNWTYVANTALNSLNASDSVSDTFPVESADGTKTSVKVTITGTNDAAVLSSAEVTLDETNAVLSTSGQLTISDVDSAQTFQAQTDVVGTHGKFSIDAQGNWTYGANTALNSLNAGDSVSDTFPVESADGTKTSVKVTITGTNDAAVLSSAEVTLDETNAVLSTSGQLTISDVDSAQTFQAQTDVVGTHGKFSIDAQGNWTYVANTALNSLNAGDSVSDTFPVESADGTKTSVKVTITGTNDAAVLSSAEVTLDETNAALSTNGKLTVTDVDSAETFKAQTDVAGTHGKFSIDAQGNWTYVANTALNSLNASDSVSD
ncbi:hypothetical protein H663_000005, partial [Limnohabitans planktonicus II-D5]